MGQTRSLLVVGLISILLSAGAVGTVSASSGDYVVDLECPEPSESLLDQDREFREDYVDCVADRKEAEIAASSGLRTIDSLRSNIDRIESVGHTLENSQFGPIQGIGDSVTDWTDEKHDQLDAEQQALVESTALEEQDDQVV